MNYAELSAAIQDYAENPFTPELVATFVQQAEQRIYNTVQLPALRKNSRSNLSTNAPYMNTPEDYLSVFSFAVISPTGRYEYLIDKDVNFIRAAYPAPNSTGLPQYYALWDQDTFMFGPSPDQPYEVELHYFYYPESIVTAGTSWLGENFDSVLLYGGLAEAATYMKQEPDIVQQYTVRYNETMALLKQLGDGKNRQDAYRNGQVRDVVR